MIEQLARFTGLYPELHWMMGQGRVKPEEPLYAFKAFLVTSNGTTDLDAIAQAESNESIAKCIEIVIERLAFLQRAFPQRGGR